ncbi:CU044_2847 family protein [Streptomyces sp. NPDC056486]|uniref:CU044_2847 family protein n=1 Tax=Streptomyces sp. NPDC056486 TaxID=3345835 RepID=UPI0036902917
MDDLVEFATDDGTPVVMADVDDTHGSHLVSRGGDGPSRAVHTFEQSLAGARAAAESALRVFRDGTLRPDSVEIEFGVRMSAEAGAVIVKGTAEGHLVVRLVWAPDGPAGTRGGARRDAAAAVAPEAAVTVAPGTATAVAPEAAGTVTPGTTTAVTPEAVGTVAPEVAAAAQGGPPAAPTAPPRPANPPEATATP